MGLCLAGVLGPHDAAQKGSLADNTLKSKRGEIRPDTLPLIDHRFSFLSPILRSVKGYEGEYLDTHANENNKRQWQ